MDPMVGVRSKMIMAGRCPREAAESLQSAYDAHARLLVNRMFVPEST
jgi:hypothetical protein